MELYILPLLILNRKDRLSEETAHMWNSRCNAKNRVEYYHGSFFNSKGSIELSIIEKKPNKFLLKKEIYSQTGLSTV